MYHFMSSNIKNSTQAKIQQLLNMFFLEHSLDPRMILVCI